jgi:hypothetical protein
MILRLFKERVLGGPVNTDVIEIKIVSRSVGKSEKRGPQNEGISVDVYDNKGPKKYLGVFV